MGVSFRLPHLHCLLESVEDHLALGLQMLLEVGLLMLLSDAGLEADKCNIRVEALLFEVQDVTFKALPHTNSHITHVLQVLQ